MLIPGRGGRGGGIQMRLFYFTRRMWLTGNSGARPPGFVLSRSTEQKTLAAWLRSFMVRHMKRCLWLVVLSVFSAPMPPARAVQMEPLSVEQLARQSALVVHGTVQGKSCQRDPAGRIFTRVELQVVDVWKGAPATNRVTVVQGGGILGHQKATVSGQVEYGIGEEVVAFLVINSRGEGVTLGLAQGKFHVSQDENSGERLVHNLFHGEPGSQGRAIPRLDSLATQRRLSLVELKRRVEKAAQ